MAELLVKRPWPFRNQARPQALPQLCRDRRHLRQPACQRLEVKPGAADENRQAALTSQFRQKLLHRTQPVTGGIDLSRRHMAIEQMGNTLHLFVCRTRRQHAQRIVDLHAVGIDHYAAMLLCERQRQRRLAAGRRSGYQDGPAIWFKVFHHGSGCHAHCPSVKPCPDIELGEQAADAVKASGLYWLADGIACDLALRDDADAASVEAALRALIGSAPIDVVVQEAETRRKKLLIADMDSTMIGQECIDELADVVGLKDKVATITARAMNGEIAFEPALRERVALLKGLPISVVDEVIEKRITLTSGGLELLATMRARGHHTALVSGGFTVFTSRIADMLGFHVNRANILLEEDGVLTGDVAEPILGKQAKVDALNEISAETRHFA